jgi:hypothetical protein
VLLVDATAFSLLVADQGEVAIGLYLAGGPTLHALHGRWQQVAWSLGLRVVLPVGLGALASSSGMPDETIENAAGGVILGVVFATAIEVLFLARTNEARGAPTPARQGQRGTLYAGPRREGGFTLGWTGTF